MRIAINEPGVIAGRIPPRALGLVLEWATIHKEELLAAWDRAQRREQPGTIEPLR